MSLTSTETSNAQPNEDQKLYSVPIDEAETKPKEKEPFIVDLIKNNIISRLFFRRKFGVHRIVGLVYIIEWLLALYFYFTDYHYLLSSPLMWSLPMTGVFQSFVAANTFTFLPKKQLDPGYFGDKSVLSYNFIKENLFYSGILLFAWLYYSDRFYPILRSTFVIETSIVFFPYVVRMLFPKTRMRDSLEVSDRNKSDKNRTFFIISTYVTKTFYIWAKHYIGYFLNYCRYLDRYTDEQKYHLMLLYIFSCFATTIALFLHTLKFKGYIGPKTSFLTYMISYFATFYTWIRIMDVFYINLDIALLVLGGVILNFAPRKAQIGYQVLMFAIFTSRRYEFLQPGTILY